MDITYHYPPDLLNLLIDTIPLLCRSKRDVLQFFRGAGVGTVVLADLMERVHIARDQINKFEIVRTVLARLNERGEPALRERREILKRVVEFEDFSSCWPDDRLKVQGLVVQVQKLVNVKDTFTRMSHERDEERRKRQEEAERETKRLQKRAEDLDQIKTDLFRLFAETNPWRRGKTLESVLNRLFLAHGVLVREAFTVRGDAGQGIVEQIDGVIELDGEIYLVEMKWLDGPVAKPDMTNHMVGVFNRGHARGIFIANPSFTEPALLVCKEGLSRSVFVLVELEEVVRLLNSGFELRAMLKAKVRAAIVDKLPLFKAWVPEL